MVVTDAAASANEAAKRGVYAMFVLQRDGLFPSFSATTTTMSVTQRKDRLYAQLASSMQRLKQASARTTDLTESVQEDLDAMRTFAGIHAAQCVNGSQLLLYLIYLLRARFMTVSATDIFSRRTENFLLQISTIARCEHPGVVHVP